MSNNMLIMLRAVPCSWLGTVKYGCRGRDCGISYALGFIDISSRKNDELSRQAPCFRKLCFTRRNFRLVCVSMLGSRRIPELSLYRCSELPTLVSVPWQLCCRYAWTFLSISHLRVFIRGLPSIRYVNVEPLRRHDSPMWPSSWLSFEILRALQQAASIESQSATSIKVSRPFYSVLCVAHLDEDAS
jgi:hypothetical protein